MKRWFPAEIFWNRFVNRPSTPNTVQGHPFPPFYHCNASLVGFGRKS
jgi:hypothetical protein